MEAKISTEIPNGLKVSGIFPTGNPNEILALLSDGSLWHYQFSQTDLHCWSWNWKKVELPKLQKEQ